MSYIDCLCYFLLTLLELLKSLIWAFILLSKLFYYLSNFISDLKCSAVSTKFYQQDNVVVFKLFHSKAFLNPHTNRDYKFKACNDMNASWKRVQQQSNCHFHISHATLLFAINSTMRSVFMNAKNCWKAEKIAKERKKLLQRTLSDDEVAINGCKPIYRGVG